jgi:hypothetical protein
MKTRTRRLTGITVISLAEFVILAVNLLLGGKLFFVEYSNQVESIEGTFIAIARQIALHPRDLLWWPLWDCGLPFQHTYLPLMHLATAALSFMTGHSAALAYHQVAAASFCLAPMTLCLMAWVITRRIGPSFGAALAWSIVSPTAILIPVMTHDLGSPLRLRRLQFLMQYGEGPETMAIALFPIAVLFLWLALRKRSFAMQVLAGFFIGLTVLANAFGATILAMAALALLASVELGRFWRNAAMTAAIAALSWCWISPLFPPSVIAAIRTNSPTVEGDYRFTWHSLAGILILAAAFAAVWFLLRRAELHLRFFTLFTVLAGGVVTLGYFGHMYVLPQPNRYQEVTDLGLCLVIAFALPRRIPRWVAIAALCVAAIQTRQQVRFCRGLIRPLDMTQTAMWRGAQWIDTHLHGQRVMVGGAYSFYVDDFTEIPQLHGGHDPMLPNPVIRDVVYEIYNGRRGDVTVSLLQEYGVHAAFLPGGSPKLDALVPVLWREGKDVIYGVPGAEDNFTWTSRHSMSVHAGRDVTRVNITWSPGWKTSRGRLYKSGLGTMILEPDCDRDCTIALTYDGGWELAATLAASSIVMLVTIVIGLVRAFHRNANVVGLLLG